MIRPAVGLIAAALVGCTGNPQGPSPQPPPPVPIHPVQADFEFRWVGEGLILPLAADINASGSIAGYAGAGQQEQPYVWELDGSVTIYEYLEFPPTYAHGINDAGSIVGYGDARGPDGRTAVHAYLRTPDGQMRDLNPPGLDGGTFARDVNNNDDVVGTISHDHGLSEPFIWTASGGFMGLGTPSGENGLAHRVNDLRTVIGIYHLPDFGDRSFVWTPTDGIFDPFDVTGGGEVFGMNDSDHLVGVRALAGGVEEAFVWERATGLVRPLTSLGDRVYVRDINNDGWVLGGGEDSLGTQYVAVWAPDGRVVRLPNPHGWQSLQVIRLSDAGHVLGYGQDPSGEGLPVVWVYQPDG